MAPFNPYAALQHAYRKEEVLHEILREAIGLLRCDRPREAENLLQDALGFEVERRIQAQDKLKA
jgi:hypothetical protein